MSNITFNNPLPTKNSIYKHYKSTIDLPKLYKIIGIAKHSETDEILVVYKPLYDNEWMNQSNADFTVRPLAMFLGNVEIDGKTTKRFNLITNYKLI